MMDDFSLEQLKTIQKAIRRADHHENAVECLASIVLLVADIVLTEMIKEKEEEKK